MTFGPWSPHCNSEERGRQLRTLAALALIYARPAHPLWRVLRTAETDHAQFLHAQMLIDRLPSLTRRLLATFSRLTWSRETG